jgi:hypothetical protein
VNDPGWTNFDEGYVSAHDWAAALTGGAPLPVEEATIELEPGEIQHTHLGGLTVGAYVPGGFQFQKIFGIFVTGEVALGRRATWRTDARTDAAPRWRRVAVADAIVTDRRLIVTNDERTGSVTLGEIGRVELVPGMEGGPALQLQPAGFPAPLQLGSPFAPLLFVFVHQLVDGRPPAVPMPPAVLERARAAGRLG